MNLREYQEHAAETAVYPDRTRLGGLLYTALGLAGEAGEVANKIKKVLRDSNGYVTHEMFESIIEELGDCLWYIAMIASELGASLDLVADVNINKLQSRSMKGSLHGSGDHR